MGLCFSIKIRGFFNYFNAVVLPISFISM
jgi:hypothetical protein